MTARGIWGPLKRVCPEEGLFPWAQARWERRQTLCCQIFQFLRKAGYVCLHPSSTCMCFNLGL